jgi:hypothetical protein
MVWNIVPVGSIPTNNYIFNKVSTCINTKKSKDKSTKKNAKKYYNTQKKHLRKKQPHKLILR